MQVSVIVCTHNRAERLPRCLEALTELDYDRSSYEILIIDNASTDPTREIVEEYLPQLAQSRYIYEPNLGLSFARNRGIAEARGPILAFTDDDCRPEPGWLRGLVAAFELLPQVGTVAGRVVPDWEEPPPPWVDGRIANAVLSCVDFADVPCVVPEGPDPVRGANIAFPREIFEHVGVFRTDLGFRGRELIGGDEHEFCLRIRRSGYSIVYTPAATVRHAIPAQRFDSEYLRRIFFGLGRFAYRVYGVDGVIEIESDRLARRHALRIAAGSFLHMVLAKRRERRLERRFRAEPTADIFWDLCWKTERVGYYHERMRSALSFLLSSRHGDDGIVAARRDAQR